MINDQELVLYYYRDGLSDERLKQIETSLRQDKLLAARYQALHDQMEQLPVMLEVPASSQVKARWHASLDAAANSTKSKTKSTRDFSWFFDPLRSAVAIPATAVLVLGLGIIIGLYWPDRQPLTQPVIGIKVDSSQSFALGVRAYLHDTETQLASLTVTDVAQRDALLNDILSRNRLYIKAAENSNAPELARVLRAFGPVLASLGDPDNSEHELQAAMAQLTFELSAMQTKLAYAASKQITRL